MRFSKNNWQTTSNITIQTSEWEPTILSHGKLDSRDLFVEINTQKKTKHKKKLIKRKTKQDRVKQVTIDRVAIKKLIDRSIRFVINNNYLKKN